MPSFGKTTPLTREHFSGFEAAYGEDPYGRSKRVDQGEEGRFRRFTRQEIARRGENLDVSWLRDSDDRHDTTADPQTILRDIRAQLMTAFSHIDALDAELQA
jgi:type I restriction enzyme M protein